MLEVEPEPAKGFQGKIRWPLVRVSEVATLHYGKALVASSREPGNVRVYGSNGQCGWHNTPLAKGPTVILGRKGQGPLGVEWCPSPFWVIDTAYHVTVDPQRVDLRYFYFLIKFIGLNHLKDGTSNPSLSRDVFGLQGVPLPPLNVQQRITWILSTYDELIENSQRRIKILESMARALYREWFVHFRFPGHESVPRVPSHLGEIPQGWEVRKLSDVAVVNRLQINARTAPGELHYIDISSVSPGQIDAITTYAFTDAPGRARRVVQHGDVLWSCVRPNRRSHVQVMHPIPGTIASTGFAVLTAKTVPFTFLYYATTTDDFVAYLTNNATGAAYPAVTATTFEKAELLVPPDFLLQKFSGTTVSMAEEIHILQSQINNLRRTRDLLLPRLLSGQIGYKCGEISS